MIILTAANSALPSDDQVRKNPNFSFRSIIEDTVEKATECGYTPVVYDLGGLGIGEKFTVEDETFAKQGFYTEVKKGYKSKSLFKPDIVKHCLETHNEFTVYIDGDAQLCDSIDEIQGDYDIGVTLRKPSELETHWFEKYGDIAGYVNAGVIFFNATPATSKFVDIWAKTTVEVGNDQKALNILVSPDKYPEPYSTITLNDTRIKFFPTVPYNYYYFEEGCSEKNIKILHFKGNVRHYYPFDKKKRFFCSKILPIWNKIKSISKPLTGLITNRD